MTIRGTKKGSRPPPNASPESTGAYSLNFKPVPDPYKPIQTPAPSTSGPRIAVIPASSTRDLNYFFNLAGSLYIDPLGSQTENATVSSALPGYHEVFQQVNADLEAVLAIWLFRHTMTHVFPIAERFHLGPADRQPLYSVTAQPSIRSAQEFNELAIKRRDPIKGVWYDVCTSDIEPSLDLVKPGNWRVAKLVMESIPVWKKIVSGQVIKENAENAKGNSLRLAWGDRPTLGPLGDAYGLWWESGGEHGEAVAFYVVEGWGGFDSGARGKVKVRAPVPNQRKLR
jgi:hypothetical protein